MARLPDMTKLSPADQKKLDELLGKAGTSIASLSGKSPLSDPAYRKKCIDLRPKFEDMAKAEGVTLAHIFTASDKLVTQYKNPQTGDIFGGRGKRPSWLIGREAEYEIKAN